MQTAPPIIALLIVGIHLEPHAGGGNALEPRLAWFSVKLHLFTITLAPNRLMATPQHAVNSFS